MIAYNKHPPTYTNAVDLSFDMREWLAANCSPQTSSIALSEPAGNQRYDDDEMLVKRKSDWVETKQAYGHLFSIEVDTISVKRGNGWMVALGGKLYTLRSGNQYQLIVEIEDETIAVAFRLALS